MKLFDMVIGLSLIALGGAGFVACGESATTSQCPGGPECVCASESQCACTDGSACSFDCAAGDCKIECGKDGTCDGTCGKDCAATCPEGASCNIDLGQDGDIQCIDADCTVAAGHDADITCKGGTCAVTCESKCDVACKEGATCTLQCAGDSEPKAIEEAGKCE